MLKCFDHQPTFLGTHNHFCPDVKISRNGPSVCCGLGLNNSKLKTNMLGFAAFVFEMFVFRKNKIRTPCVKIWGYPTHSSSLFFGSKESSHTKRFYFSIACSSTGRNLTRRRPPVGGPPSC